MTGPLDALPERIAHAPGAHRSRSRSAYARAVRSAFGRPVRSASPKCSRSAARRDSRPPARASGNQRVRAGALLNEAAIAAAAAPGSGELVIGRPMTSRSAPAGRTPGVIRAISGPTSDRRLATSHGEQTRPAAPASTASTPRRRTASLAVPSIPSPARSASPREVRTVTPMILVPGAASAAARTMAGPPAACTVSMSGRSRVTARAAPATVAGMSCSLRSRNTWTLLAPRIEATESGPYRRYSPSPIFTVLTCGVTRCAQRAAVSMSGASRATAIGAGYATVLLPPRSSSLERLSGDGAHEPRSAVLVRDADHVGDPANASPGKLLLQLPGDPQACRWIMEQRGAHAHHRGTGQHQLERVPPGQHAAHADDGDLWQGLADLPDAPDRDRPDGRPGQASGEPGKDRPHRHRVDGHSQQRVDEREAVRAGSHAGPRYLCDVGHVG